MDMQSRLVSFLVVAGERHLLKRMEFRGISLVVGSTITLKDGFCL